MIYKKGFFQKKILVLQTLFKTILIYCNYYMIKYKTISNLIYQNFTIFFII